MKYGRLDSRRSLAILPATSDFPVAVVAAVTAGADTDVGGSPFAFPFAGGRLRQAAVR